MASDPAAVLDPAVVVSAIETAVKSALGPVVGRLRALETSAAELQAVRERVAALEARPPLPGPPGPPGEPGRPGADGLPGMTYRGVYVPDAKYGRGDCVTAGGSLWHCNAETADRPGAGSPAWTLAVKRGRDAKERS